MFLFNDGLSLMISRLSEPWTCRLNPLSATPTKMVKYIQTIRWLMPLSVFEHIVGLALNGLRGTIIFHIFSLAVMISLQHGN